jgi:cell division protein ZapA
MADDNVITVDIYDQTYRLNGSDREYVERLAATVDGKMRAVAEHGRTVDCAWRYWRR